jgi:dynein intermediate chain
LSTSTSDLETDDEDGAGPSRPRKIRDGGNGRETEDEMRKRLLTEMEDERKSLERELKELKEKTDEARLAGKLAGPLVSLS